MPVDPTALEQERRYLFGLAYRLLGSAADAEDVLQEAFLRARDVEDVRAPRALLTTIVTRLCLDEVRSARRRRETYVGPWLPEPIATAAPGADDRLETAESLSMAFLLLLESLSPLERAVFVLREVLDLDFPAIARAVGRSEAACRQLLHRARGHVDEGRARYAVPPAAARGLVAGFLGALAAGDVDALTRLLADDVVAVSDHGGKAKAIRRPVGGSDRVGRFLVGLVRKLPGSGWTGFPTWLNGEPAFVAVAGGEVVSAMLFELAASASGAPRVSAVRVVRNPDKLKGLTAAWREGRLRPQAA